MIELLSNYLLKVGGIHLEFSKDGGFWYFTKSGLNYIVIYDHQSDSNYFRIILPNLYEITNENKIETYDAINRTNMQYKVVKFTDMNSKVWASAESFVFSYENVENLFSRLISGLEGASNFFSGLLNRNSKDYVQ